MFRFALFLLSTTVSCALAELYVASPDSATTCTAGKSCTVTWLDNGVAPTVESIGVCTVGLYHGTQQLVQTIKPVNVADSHSLTFTPQTNAGPNSDTYYIAFKSKTRSGNSTSDYAGFSANFKLTGMTGSFDSPVASLTSSITAASSLSSSANPVSVSTLPGTVTLSVSSATTSPTPTSPSSRLTTSSARSASTASSSSSGASPSASASAAGAASAASARRPALALVSALFLIALTFVAYV